MESQLACKEREWKELQALRVQQLETALNDATSELSVQRERFLRLRDDFQYNLRVLEERDKELERYDALAARALTEDGARREEVSELRIEIAKLQDALEEHRKMKGDLELQYQKRGVEHRLKLEKVQRYDLSTTDPSSHHLYSSPIRVFICEWNFDDTRSCSLGRWKAKLRNSGRRMKL